MPVYAIGLGPRKFRSAYAELGDQSVWTDTPAEKARKAAGAREKEMVRNKKMHYVYYIRASILHRIL